ncbi:MAG: hypothetical protein RL885_31840 [Planctomycetota bacterium]
MANSDLAINVRIRNVLASHWVDLRLVQFRAYKGTVRLTGMLKRITKINDSVPMPIPQIEAEVRRIDGVKSVFCDFDNFIKNMEGSWVERDDR